MRVIVRAYNSEGYHKDILVFDEKQIRMHEMRVKECLDGMTIVPADFPEMVRFAIVVDRWEVGK